MTIVKFELVNARGEQIETPLELDVAVVPAKDAYVGFFDRSGTVVQVAHRYGRGRGVALKEEITVTIRASLLESLKHPARMPDPQHPDANQPDV
ncbi:hypothetical protein HFN89_01030 [Rhizobium laguerreae]|nr:hypothetical protein [Rhizobium laguerreae]